MFVLTILLNLFLLIDPIISEKLVKPINNSSKIILEYDKKGEKFLEKNDLKINVYNDKPESIKLVLNEDYKKISIDISNERNENDTIREIEIVNNVNDKKNTLESKENTTTVKSNLRNKIFLSKESIQSKSEEKIKQLEPKIIESKHSRTREHEKFKRLRETSTPTTTVKHLPTNPKQSDLIEVIDSAQLNSKSTSDSRKHLLSIIKQANKNLKETTTDRHEHLKQILEDIRNENMSKEIVIKGPRQFKNLLDQLTNKTRTTKKPKNHRKHRIKYKETNTAINIDIEDGKRKLIRKKRHYCPCSMAKLNLVDEKNLARDIENEDEDDIIGEVSQHHQLSNDLINNRRKKLVNYHIGSRKKGLQNQKLRKTWKITENDDSNSKLVKSVEISKLVAENRLHNPIVVSPSKIDQESLENEDDELESGNQNHSNILRGFIFKNNKNRRVDHKHSPVSEEIILPVKRIQYHVINGRVETKILKSKNDIHLPPTNDSSKEVLEVLISKEYANVSKKGATSNQSSFSEDLILKITNGKKQYLKSTKDQNESEGNDSDSGEGSDYDDNHDEDKHSKIYKNTRNSAAYKDVSGEMPNGDWRKNIIGKNYVVHYIKGNKRKQEEDKKTSAISKDVTRPEIPKTTLLNDNRFETISQITTHKISTRSTKNPLVEQKEEKQHSSIESHQKSNSSTTSLTLNQSSTQTQPTINASRVTHSKIDEPTTLYLSTLPILTPKPNISTINLEDNKKVELSILNKLDNNTFKNDLKILHAKDPYSQNENSLSHLSSSTEKDSKSVPKEDFEIDIISADIMKELEENQKNIHLKSLTQSESAPNSTYNAQTSEVTSETSTSTSTFGFLSFDDPFLLGDDNETDEFDFIPIKTAHVTVNKQPVEIKVKSEHPTEHFEKSNATISEKITATISENVSSNNVKTTFSTEEIGRSSEYTTESGTLLSKIMTTSFIENSTINKNITPRETIVEETSKETTIAITEKTIPTSEVEEHVKFINTDLKPEYTTTSPTSITTPAIHKIESNTIGKDEEIKKPKTKNLFIVKHTSKPTTQPTTIITESSEEDLFDFVPESPQVSDLLNLITDTGNVTNKVNRNPNKIDQEYSKPLIPDQSLNLSLSEELFGKKKESAPTQSTRHTLNILLMKTFTPSKNISLPENSTRDFQHFFGGEISTTTATTRKFDLKNLKRIYLRQKNKKIKTTTPQRFNLSWISDLNEPVTHIIHNFTHFLHKGLKETTRIFRTTKFPTKSENTTKKLEINFNVSEDLFGPKGEKWHPIQSKVTSKPNTQKSSTSGRLIKLLHDYNGKNITIKNETRNVSTVEDLALINDLFGIKKNTTSGNYITKRIYIDIERFSKKQTPEPKLEFSDDIFYAENESGFKSSIKQEITPLKKKFDPRMFMSFRFTQRAFINKREVQQKDFDDNNEKIVDSEEYKDDTTTQTYFTKVFKITEKNPKRISKHFQSTTIDHTDEIHQKENLNNRNKNSHGSLHKKSTHSSRRKQKTKSVNHRKTTTQKPSELKVTKLVKNSRKSHKSHINSTKVVSSKSSTVTKKMYSTESSSTTKGHLFYKGSPEDQNSSKEIEASKLFDNFFGTGEKMVDNLIKNETEEQKMLKKIREENLGTKRENKNTKNRSVKKIQRSTSYQTTIKHKVPHHQVSYKRISKQDNSSKSFSESGMILEMINTTPTMVKFAGEEEVVECAKKSLLSKLNQNQKHEKKSFHGDGNRENSTTSSPQGNSRVTVKSEPWKPLEALGNRKNITKNTKNKLSTSLPTTNLTFSPLLDALFYARLQNLYNKEMKHIHHLPDPKSNSRSKRSIGNNLSTLKVLQFPRTSQSPHVSQFNLKKGQIDKRLAESINSDDKDNFNFTSFYNHFFQVDKTNFISSKRKFDVNDARPIVTMKSVNREQDSRESFSQQVQNEKNNTHENLLNQLDLGEIPYKLAESDGSDSSQINVDSKYKDGKGIESASKLPKRKFKQPSSKEKQKSFKSSKLSSSSSSDTRKFNQSNLSQIYLNVFGFPTRKKQKNKTGSRLNTSLNADNRKLPTETMDSPNNYTSQYFHSKFKFSDEESEILNTAMKSFDVKNLKELQDKLILSKQKSNNINSANDEEFENFNSVQKSSNQKLKGFKNQKDDTISNKESSAIDSNSAQQNFEKQKHLSEESFKDVKPISFQQLKSFEKKNVSRNLSSSSFFIPIEQRPKIDSGDKEPNTIQNYSSMHFRPDLLSLGKYVEIVSYSPIPKDVSRNSIVGKPKIKSNDFENDLKRVKIGLKSLKHPHPYKKHNFSLLSNLHENHKEVNMDSEQEKKLDVLKDNNSNFQSLKISHPKRSLPLRKLRYPSVYEDVFGARSQKVYSTQPRPEKNITNNKNDLKWLQNDNKNKNNRHQLRRKKINNTSSTFDEIFPDAKFHKSIISTEKPQIDKRNILPQSQTTKYGSLHDDIFENPQKDFQKLRDNIKIGNIYPKNNFKRYQRSPDQNSGIEFFINPYISNYLKEVLKIKNRVKRSHRCKNSFINIKAAVQPVDSLSQENQISPLNAEEDNFVVPPERVPKEKFSAENDDEKQSTTSTTNQGIITVIYNSSENPIPSVTTPSSFKPVYDEKTTMMDTNNISTNNDFKRMCKKKFSSNYKESYYTPFKRFQHQNSSTMKIPVKQQPLEITNDLFDSQFLKIGVKNKNIFPSPQETFVKSGPGNNFKKIYSKDNEKLNEFKIIKKEHVYNTYDLISNKQNLNDIKNYQKQVEIWKKKSQHRYSAQKLNFPFLDFLFPGVVSKKILDKRSSTKLSNILKNKKITKEPDIFDIENGDIDSSNFGYNDHGTKETIQVSSVNTKWKSTMSSAKYKTSTQNKLSFISKPTKFQNFIKRKAKFLKIPINPKSLYNPQEQMTWN